MWQCEQLKFLAGKFHALSAGQDLIAAQIQQFADSMDKTIEIIPEETMRALVCHCWPGNIRELQNYIARGVVHARALPVP